MSHSASTKQRVLSGMRATGRLHLGHYHGVLKNWLHLQHEYDCFFMVADWHSMTTHYDDLSHLEEHVWQMVIDWLAVGISPSDAHLFIQSRVPEQAELQLLLGMITPLAWLERVPTYKEQQNNIDHKDLSTFGFLGYPVLQAADILAYRAGLVPVGEDQVPHVELTREIARRFNHFFGKDQDFEVKATLALKKLGKKQAQLYQNLRKQFQEKGEHQAQETAEALIDGQSNLSLGEREILWGYLSGDNKIILPEPKPHLTPAAKMLGLDGRKMSKSYGNVIGLREEPDSVVKKVRTMPTDPARVRRADPGSPDKCPVFALHQIYSPDDTRKWIKEGCTTAGIGCLECKQPLIDAILQEQGPIRERAKPFEEDPSLVKAIVAEGGDAAREVAKATLNEVKTAMGLSYS